MDKKLTCKRTLLSMLVAGTMCYSGAAMAEVEAERICTYNGNPTTCAKVGTGYYYGSKTAESGTPSGANYGASLTGYDTASFAALTGSSYGHQAAVSGIWGVDANKYKDKRQTYSALISVKLEGNKIQISDFKNADDTGVRIGGVAGAIVAIAGGNAAHTVFNYKAEAIVTGNQALINNSNLDVKPQSGNVGNNALTYTVSGAYNYWGSGFVLEDLFAIKAIENSVTVDNSTIKSELHNGVVGYYGDLGSSLANNSKLSLVAEKNGVTIQNGSIINTNVMGIGGSINSNSVIDLGTLQTAAESREKNDTSCKSSGTLGTFYDCYKNQKEITDNSLKNVEIVLDISHSFVKVSDSTVNGDIIGGYGDLNGINGNSSADIKLMNSEIDIESSNITGDIYGSKFVTKGYGTSNTDTYKNTTVLVSGNEIKIANGAEINGDIYAAYGDFKTVENITNSSLNFTDNKVILTGDVQKEFGNIYGGYIDVDYSKIDADSKKNIDIFSGNEFIVKANNPFKVDELGNFDSIHFEINKDNKKAVFSTQENGKAFITAEEFVIADGLDDKADKRKKTTLVISNTIRGESGGKYTLKPGTEFTLLHAEHSYYVNADGSQTEAKFTDMMELDDHSSKKKIKLLTGLIYETDAELMVKDVEQTDQTKEANRASGTGNHNDNDNDGGEVVVIVTGEKEVDKETFERTKGLYEGRLAQLANTSNGAGMLLDVLHEYKPHEDRRWTPIATTSLGLNKYNSGPDIRATEFHALIGSLYQRDKVTIGPFLEYGHSNYTTHENFQNQYFYGAGSSYYYGVGALAKYTEEDKYYYDASLRIGKTKLDYRSSDITTDHSNVDYSTKSTYWGAHIGGARIVPIDAKNSLDIGLHFVYTEVMSDDVSILGSNVQFDKMQSARLQFHPQYFYKADENATVLTGLGYEYEFIGKSEGNIDGLSQHADSIKGGTGFAELGFKWAASNDEDSFIGLKGIGYIGKRNGGTAQIFAQYKFK